MGSRRFPPASGLSRPGLLASLLCLVAAALASSWGFAEQPKGGGRPRLAVLVVFDQLRGDYLSRWQDLFGPDGFRRLQHDGVWFANCHYPYAHTVTGSGHASLLTGCSPDVHGIVGNDWYNRATGETVYCTGPEGLYQPVTSPLAPADGWGGLLGKKSRGGVSPEQLLAPTLGDTLKEATGGKARIVSLSLKDRSAVLPPGRAADACYWFDTATGTFVTSSYYTPRLPPWVDDFNRGRPADRWFGQTWTRLRPDLDYVKWSGPDDAPGEGIGFAQGRTFPHPMTGGLTKPGRVSYEALTLSPYGNDLLLDLAKRAIDAEHLGQHEVPDLLCVSFSANDLIGHCWGPDSQEVLDVTLRSDLIVRDLLAHLDARVGKGQYLLAVTADHGVCPIPEVARARGEDAGRVDTRALTRNAEEFLTRTFGQAGKDPWLEATPYPWIYLRHRTVRERRLDQAQVEEALARWLPTQPGVLTAYTRTQLLRGLPAADTLGNRVRRSFYPERCGDVAVVLKPNYLFTSTFLFGTTHGCPHPYDTHVPLLIYGTGIGAAGQPVQEAVTPQAVAAIFARGLGVKLPSRAEAPVPDRLARLGK